jgi:hypothetical protein
VSKASRDRLSDRIAIGMLIQAFPPDQVDAAIDAAGVREQRSRALPARTMVYFALAMWLFGGAGYDSVLTRLTTGMRWAGVMTGNRSEPSTGSITKARKRLGSEVMRRLFLHRATADVDTPARWRGMRVCTLDGGAIDVPDTVANLEAFASSEVRMVALAAHGDGALLDVAVGSPDDELDAMVVGSVGQDTLVVANRPWSGYEVCQVAAEQGAHLLWRPKDAVAVPCLRVLSDDSYLSRLLPDNDPLARSIEVRVVPCGESVLITTLLDPVRAPASELVSLHRGRWRFEAVWNALEAEPVTLRSQDPHGVAQELWAMLCVYQAIQAWRWDGKEAITGRV